jgi:uncharacterized protein
LKLFRRSEKSVRTLIIEYFDAADKAVYEFESVVLAFLGGGSDTDLEQGDRRIHQAESFADDLRVKIEKELYSQALLPESRGDILGLLESFDRMPNLAETITFMLFVQRIQVPRTYSEDMVKLVGINIEAYRMVRQMVDKLFTEPKTIAKAMEEVDVKESESDQLERDLIYKVFRSDLPAAHMIMLRELIEKIGDISDSAERVSHRIEIISLKKRI